MDSYITYGIGGYDPSLPHDNVVEQLINHGDGTGTFVDYSSDPIVVMELTDLPIPESTPVEPITVLLEKLSSAQSMEEVRAAAAEVQESLQ